MITPIRHQTHVIIIIIPGSSQEMSSPEYQCVVYIYIYI